MFPFKLACSHTDSACAGQECGGEGTNPDVGGRGASTAAAEGHKRSGSRRLHRVSLASVADFIDPLFFVLGANLTGDRIVTIFEGFHAGSLSLRTCLQARRQEDLRLSDELVGQIGNRK